MTTREEFLTQSLHIFFFLFQCGYLDFQKWGKARGKEVQWMEEEEEEGGEGGGRKKKCHEGENIDLWRSGHAFFILALASVDIIWYIWDRGRREEEENGPSSLLPSLSSFPPFSSLPSWEA